MKFDLSTDTCYLAAYMTGKTANYGELQIVNPTDASTKLIGAFEDNSEITGFAIPYHYIPKGYDVGVASIDEDQVMPVQAISPKATIINHGKDASFRVTITISDGYTDTINVSNLASMDAIQITFKNMDSYCW